MKIQVKFTKIGNQIKFELPCKMYCTDMKTEIPSTMTLSKHDGLLITWLGKNIDHIFKNRQIILKKVDLRYAYDKCDVIGIRKLK